LRRIHALPQSAGEPLVHRWQRRLRDTNKHLYDVSSRSKVLSQAGELAHHTAMVILKRYSPCAGDPTPHQHNGETGTPWYWLMASPDAIFHSYPAISLRSWGWRISNSGAGLGCTEREY
jgi:hypothetical protein